MSAEVAPLGTGTPRGVWRARLFYAFLLFSAAVGIATLGTLVVQVLLRGIPFTDAVLLFEPPSADPRIAGARPAILATIYIGLLLIAFTVPIGVGTAI